MRFGVVESHAWLFSMDLARNKNGKSVDDFEI